MLIIIASRSMHHCSGDEERYEIQCDCATWSKSAYLTHVEMLVLMLTLGVLLSHEELMAELLRFIYCGHALGMAETAGQHGMTFDLIPLPCTGLT